MSYLTYNQKFQNNMVRDKLSNMKVKDLCAKYEISVYTLYKIMHMNGKMPTPSQASVGIDSEEGVEHRNLSPNNNGFHERPASTWKYYGTRHKKTKHICFRCQEIFYARDRGDRTKFCSPKCKSLYQTEQNSAIKVCDNCEKNFRIKNSQINHFIHCEGCRSFNLGRTSSKTSRLMGAWLRKHFIVESEKTFLWFYDKNKPKGRFRLDYFLPEHNVAIEYDGEQHFRPCFTSRWESVDKVSMRDKLKECLCDQHEIKTIRFRYDDDVTEKSMLMKIYAELQENELVEVRDKKLSR